MKILLLSLALLTQVTPAQAGGSFFRYLLRTADLGEAESQLVLGLAYRDGWDGVVKVGSATAKWYELATELGDQRPGLLLGLLQDGPDRVPQNRAEALNWLRLAADHGDQYAQVILGDMLLEGDGTPADWRGGAAFIRKAAKGGFAPAQFRLGIIYLAGDASTPNDEVEALAWFILAAEAGSKSAQEYRDEHTRLLGRDMARLAIQRSCVLRGECEPAAGRLGL
jgi:TPR repeat protein